MGKTFVPFALLLALVAGVAGISAKDTQSPKYKNVEVKHFVVADGVALTQNFVNVFYDALRDQLQKDAIAGQVVEEGTAIPDADAADSIVVAGKFTLFKPAGRSMSSPGKVDWEIDVYRKSDHSLITTLTRDLSTPGWKEDALAKACGQQAAHDIKKGLK